MVKNLHKPNKLSFRDKGRDRQAEERSKRGIILRIVVASFFVFKNIFITPRRVSPGKARKTRLVRRDINHKDRTVRIIALFALFLMLFAASPKIANAADEVIWMSDIQGIEVPAIGGTPVATITETEQYTGDVTWTPPDNPFAAATVYTATITLSPKVGYTLVGVPANFFTVPGAKATNSADSGVITAVFSETFSGGTGTVADPYQVSSCLQLQTIGSIDQNFNNPYTDKNFELTQSIDCSDTANWNPTTEEPFYNQGFIPISTFSGVFAGKGYSINDLYIDAGTSFISTNGLFSAVNGGHIRNLEFARADVQSTGGLTGIVAGWGLNGATFTNIHTSGNITPVVSASFSIERLDDGIFYEVYKQGFPVKFTTKNFEFKNINNSLTLKINQKGRYEFAGVDAAILSACGTELTPASAVYSDTNENVLNDISRIDNNVIVTHEKPFEVTWDMPQGCTTATLKLNANEYGRGVPMQFPQGGTVSYILGSNEKTINPDGKISETDGSKVSYTKYLKPSSGHPWGNAYVYFADDSTNLYVTADITPDNTNDIGKDWFAVSVNGKRFVISDSEHTYGACGFGTTSKANYKHATCEVKIPKSEIGAKANVALGFEYYGTAAYNAYGGIAGRLSDSTITSSDSSADINDGGSVGGLVGESLGSSVITKSYATGDMSGYGSVGGLVGILGSDEYTSSITRSYSTGSISGDYYVGGLVGYATDHGSISDTYSLSNVNGNYSVADSYSIGGLVGSSSGLVQNSYSTGTVTNTTDTPRDFYSTGGFIGDDQAAGDNGVSSSFNVGDVSAPEGTSYVGGFIGYGSDFYDYKTSDNYWFNNLNVGVGDNRSDDIQPNRAANTGYFKGADVHSKSPFTTWDFDNIWYAHANNYPTFLPSVSYSLSYNAGLNGSISGNLHQAVDQGAAGSQVTAVPATGYHFVSWSDGVLTASRTDSNVQDDINVIASFAINIYTLTYTAGAGGTIDGESPQTANHGADGTEVTALPGAGYFFAGWSDGVLTASRTDLNVQSSITVTASFAFGDVYIWASDGTTNTWSDPNNWLVDGFTPLTAPGIGDSVIFNDTSLENVTIDVPVDVTLLSFYQTYTGVITVEDNINVSQNLLIETGVALPLGDDGVNGHTLTVGEYSFIYGTVTANIDGTLNFDKLNIEGGTINAVDGDMTVGNNLNNNGTINYTGGGNIIVSAGYLHNHGTISTLGILDGDGGLDINGLIYNTGSINNAGLISTDVSLSNEGSITSNLGINIAAGVTNSGTITSRDDLHVLSGNLNNNSGSINICDWGSIDCVGNLQIDSGSFINSGAVGIYDGSGDIAVSGNITNSDLGGIYDKSGNISTTGDMVNAGSIWTDTGDVLATGNITNTGSVWTGIGDILANGHITNSGSIWAGTGDISADGDITNLLTMWTGNNGSITIGGMLRNYGTLSPDGDVSVNGDATNAGTAVLSAGANPGTWTFESNFNNGPTAVVTATSGIWYIAKNFTNYNPNNFNFNHNFGTITFDSANNSQINGSTDFFNLSAVPGKYITFESDTTQNIFGDLNLTGTAGHIITLRSSASPTQASINPTGTINVSHIDVKDNNNLSGVYINPLSSIDQGNNLFWFEPSFVHSITSSANAGGTISPLGTIHYSDGAGQAYTITPNSGYTIKDVLVDGSSIGVVTSYEFTNITAHHTIVVAFESETTPVIPPTPPVSPPDNPPITPQTETKYADIVILPVEHGSIVPDSSDTRIEEGKAYTFSVIPDEGYTISDITDNGSSITVSKCVFENEIAKCSIIVGEETVLGDEFIATHELSAVMKAKDIRETGETTDNTTHADNTVQKKTGLAVFLSSFTDTAVRIIKQTPPPVAYTFPWLLFLLLAYLTYRLAKQAKNESEYAGRLIKLVDVDKSIGLQKESFIVLSSHYLRTPVTIINAGVDLYLSLSKVAKDKAAAITDTVKSLNIKVEAIFKEISDNTYLKTINTPDVKEEKIRIISSPFLWFPVVSIGLIAFVADYLFIKVANIDINIINLLTEIIAYVILAQFFFSFFRKRQTRKNKNQKCYDDLKKIQVLDTARNDFMEHVVLEINSEVKALELLMVEVPEDKKNEINKGIFDLKQMVYKFSFLANLQTGNAQTMFRKMNLRPVVLDYIRANKEMISVKNTHIDFPNGDYALETDKDKFIFIIHSVLDNAIKFSKANGTVVMNWDSAKKVITITDEGVGMSKEATNTLFKPFMRGTSTLEFNYEGMGTNLYIAKLIADYLGIKISIKSELDKGTAVTLTIG